MTAELFGRDLQALLAAGGLPASDEKSPVAQQ
jgi:hypothetical protein